MDGNPAAGWAPALSADGRSVAFFSAQDDLVPNCSGGTIDIFVRDTGPGSARTECAVAGDHTVAGAFDGTLSISGNGRLLVFSSTLSGLIDRDTNDVTDVFVRDRGTGLIRRLSESATGAEADGGSGAASISVDGRYAVFLSAATNLVPGDTNGVDDVFVKDLRSGRIERVDVAADGTQGTFPAAHPAISADGRYVVFDGPGGLVPGPNPSDSAMYEVDRRTHRIFRISIST
jgi:Tol biopolymer transport system component